MTITITQSYANVGGAGPRQGPLSVTTDYATTGFGLGAFVDGDTGTYNVIDAAQGIAGKALVFTLNGLPRAVSKFKIKKDATVGDEVFQFQGWDGASWNDLGSPLTITSATEVEQAADATDSYQKFRFLGVSGTSSGFQWKEVEFEISGNQYEAGNRRTSYVIPFVSGFTINGSLSPAADGLIDGSFTGSCFAVDAQTVDGTCYVQLSFGEAICLKTFFWYFGNFGTFGQGDWKVQRLDNGVTWVDVSDEFILYDGVNFIDCGSDDIASFDWRIVGVSGATQSAPYWTEWQFDITAGSEPPPEDLSLIASLEDDAQLSGVLSIAGGPLSLFLTMFDDTQLNAVLFGTNLVAPPIQTIVVITGR